MDSDFINEWHKVQIPPNPDDLRNSLLAAGLKPSSAPRQAVASKPDKKKKKASRRGGKQTNTHMAAILKDFSHMRK
jgi:transcription initiation factor TFIIE subunit beta